MKVWSLSTTVVFLVTLLFATRTIAVTTFVYDNDIITGVTELEFNNQIWDMSLHNSGWNELVGTSPTNPLYDEMFALNATASLYPC